MANRPRLSARFSACAPSRFDPARNRRPASFADSIATPQSQRDRGIRPSPHAPTLFVSFLVIDWLKFLPALVLLLAPGDLFYRPQHIRYRAVSRDWEGHWRRTLAHGLHAIDLGRALLGTWLLLESLQAAVDARGFARYAVPLAQGSISVVAVLVQTSICRERDSFIAPFAFVTGLLLGGVAPLVAAFSLALAIPIAAGARSPAAFFPLLGIAHLGIGFWFLGKSALFPICFGAVAAMLPLVWSAMFRCDLVVSYRARRREVEPDPDPLR